MSLPLTPPPAPESWWCQFSSVLTVGSVLWLDYALATNQEFILPLVCLGVTILIYSLSRSGTAAWFQTRKQARKRARKLKLGY